ncbi:HERV-H LTR-associating protein 2 isoform X8 [Notamacropus eugenii]|uniref:HERV-H LTR-associating protein 2 isoform X8 n=1 Tax=Notamacropus eugenii TaxID=9315 RepID=UPI003B6708C3
MKVQPLLNLYLLNVLVLPLMGFDDGFHFPYFYRMSSVSMPTIVGRLNEEVILPCSFKKGQGIVIHWKKDNKVLHSYYRESDQLEKQDPHYAHRTSLLLNEINNGNASLKLRRLNLQDEGVYTCYAATETDSETIEVKLKLGAFIVPVMEYREQNGNDYLTCYLFGAYPFANITWTANNATNPENNIEVSSHPLPSVKSQLNITGSNSSYQCIIENSVLNQRWIGKWKTEEPSKGRVQRVIPGVLLLIVAAFIVFAAPCYMKHGKKKNSNSNSSLAENNHVQMGSLITETYDSVSNNPRMIKVSFGNGPS